MGRGEAFVRNGEGERERFLMAVIANVGVEGLVRPLFIPPVWGRLREYLALWPMASLT